MIKNIFEITIFVKLYHHSQFATSSSPGYICATPHLAHAVYSLLAGIISDKVVASSVLDRLAVQKVAVGFEDIILFTIIIMSSSSASSPSF